MENKSVNDIITKVTSKTIGKEHNNKIENYLYFEEERIKNKISTVSFLYSILLKMKFTMIELSR